MYYLLFKYSKDANVEKVKNVFHFPPTSPAGLCTNVSRGTYKHAYNFVLFCF